MKVNVAKHLNPVFTHEGAVAQHMNPELQLRRSVMACLLWEDTFYEDGQSIAERIKAEIASVSPAIVAAIAVEARSKMKLRHVPLLIVREMARLPKHKALVAETLEKTIQRADELAEFLAIYWKDGRQKLSAQVKKGLAKAFIKFDAYNLAKYNRDGAVKLRDVLFLSHAKPKDEAQAATWKKLVDKTLEAPDTWEVALSAGADKKATFERLMAEKKLYALAFIRNLRNMAEAGIPKETVATYAAELNVERALPFRFITAARMVPQWEDMLEPLMFKCLGSQDKLQGRTVLLVDVSGSMDAALSSKSQASRMDAGFGLGVLLREICEDVQIFTFSEQLVLCPPRRGFALRDAMKSSQPHSGTYLAAAIKGLHGEGSTGEHEYQSAFYGSLQTYRTNINIKPLNVAYDRIIVITDEQSHDGIEAPRGKGYVINVASNQNGVGYGAWTHIDGWSESAIEYIRASEVSP